MGSKHLVVPTVLMVVLLYVYASCLFATYWTAACYHTLLECAIGYTISLLVQVPLVLLSLFPFAFAMMPLHTGAA